MTGTVSIRSQAHADTWERHHERSGTRDVAADGWRAGRKRGGLTDGRREVVYEWVHVRALEIVPREVALGEADDAHTALDGLAGVEAAVWGECLEGDGLELRLGIRERRRLDEARLARELDRAPHALRSRGGRRRGEVRVVVGAHARPEGRAPERLLPRRLFYLDLSRDGTREEDHQCQGGRHHAADATQEGEELGRKP